MNSAQPATPKSRWRTSHGRRVQVAILGVSEICYLVQKGRLLNAFTARCSVTSFILSTSMVRTCIGCSRKALLPVSQSSAVDDNWLPTAARSWVVKELLEAVQRCLFCGNSFVAIV